MARDLLKDIQDLFVLYVAARKLLVDDFEGEEIRNRLGVRANVFQKAPSKSMVSRREDTIEGQPTRVLLLRYDKQNEGGPYGMGGWCGYYTLLNEIDGDYFDATPYKAVSVLVRGAAGGESFEVGMADKNWQTIGDSVKAGPVEKYLPRGITTEWQELIIPLADFGSMDFPQMGSLVFNFHKQGQGIVDLDDLLLIRKTEQEMLEAWDD